MTSAKLLALLVGVLIATVGVVGVADPSIPIGFGQQVHSTSALYAVAAVRVAMGAVLALAAPGSRMPRTLLVLGVLMIIGGVATPFFGVERLQALLAWFAGQGPVLTRAGAGVAVALGAFIIFAARVRS